MENIFLSEIKTDLKEHNLHYKISDKHQDVNIPNQLLSDKENEEKMSSNLQLSPMEGLTPELEFNTTEQEENKVLEMNAACNQTKFSSLRKAQCSAYIHSKKSYSWPNLKATLAPEKMDINNQNKELSFHIPFNVRKSIWSNNKKESAPVHLEISKDGFQEKNTSEKGQIQEYPITQNIFNTINSTPFLNAGEIKKNSTNLQKQCGGTKQNKVHDTVQKLSFILYRLKDLHNHKKEAQGQYISREFEAKAFEILNQYELFLMQEKHRLGKILMKGYNTPSNTVQNGLSRKTCPVKPIRKTTQVKCLSRNRKSRLEDNSPIVNHLKSRTEIITGNIMKLHGAEHILKEVVTENIGRKIDLTEDNTHDEMENHTSMCLCDYITMKNNMKLYDMKQKLKRIDTENIDGKIDLPNNKNHNKNKSQINTEIIMGSNMKPQDIKQKSKRIDTEIIDGEICLPKNKAHDKTKSYLSTKITMENNRKLHDTEQKLKLMDTDNIDGKTDLPKNETHYEEERSTEITMGKNKKLYDTKQIKLKRIDTENIDGQIDLPKNKTHNERESHISAEIIMGNNMKQHDTKQKLKRIDTENIDGKMDLPKNKTHNEKENHLSTEITMGKNRKFCDTEKKLKPIDTENYKEKIDQPKIKAHNEIENHMSTEMIMENNMKLHDTKQKLKRTDTENIEIKIDLPKSKTFSETESHIYQDSEVHGKYLYRQAIANSYHQKILKQVPLHNWDFPEPRSTFLTHIGSKDNLIESRPKKSITVVEQNDKSSQNFERNSKIKLENSPEIKKKSKSKSLLKKKTKPDKSEKPNKRDKTIRITDKIIENKQNNRLNDEAAANKPNSCSKAKKSRRSIFCAWCPRGTVEESATVPQDDTCTKGM